MYGAPATVEVVPSGRPIRSQASLLAKQEHINDILKLESKELN